MRGTQLHCLQILTEVDRLITGEDMAMFAMLMDQNVPSVAVHPARLSEENRGIIKDVQGDQSLEIRTSRHRGDIRHLLQEHFSGRVEDQPTDSWVLAMKAGEVFTKKRPCQTMSLACSHGGR